MKTLRENDRVQGHFHFCKDIFFIFLCKNESVGEEKIHIDAPTLRMPKMNSKSQTNSTDEWFSQSKMMEF